MQDKYQLKQGWLWRMPVIGSILSLFLLVSLTLLTLAVNSCDDLPGWESLSCGLGLFFILGPIAGITFIILGAVLLKRWVVTDRLTATLIMLPVFGFVAASIFSDAVSSSFNLGSWLRLFVLGTISMSIVVWLAALLFSYTNRINQIVSVLVCILLTPIVYGLTGFVPRTLGQYQRIQDEKSEIANLSFKVYQPSYIASRYELGTGQDGPGLEHPSEYREPGEPESPTYYEFLYKSTVR